MLLSASARWRASFPGAAIGVLAMRGVANPESSPWLDARKTALEAQLRERYGGLSRGQLRSLPVLQAYATYYKRFDKTYHVQLQLESIVLKAKPIPRSAALVEAMFMAEMKNLLLTAGHDRDVLQGPLRVDVATGDESYALLGRGPQILKAGDMFIQDGEGVLSSILYGPGDRSKISLSTTRALFTVYAPAGIGLEPVSEHLGDLRDNVLAVTPQAEVEALEVIPGS